MVEGRWLPPGKDIEPALALRREIFHLEKDETDALAWQALALMEGKPVGTGRIWWQDGAFHIGMIGVLEAYRCLGFGDFLTRLLLYKAQTHGASLVLLRTPPETAPFFERYGFSPCGKAEQDGALPYALKGSEIALDTCRGCRR